MATANVSTVKYTWAQVKEHNKDDDLWVVIRDHVYDLSRFLNEHPGGPEVLQENAGKEATKEFDEVGHSKDAITQMKQYLVGEIADNEKKSVNSVDKEQKKKICIGVCSLLAIGVGAFIIYQGYKLIKST